MNGRLGFSSFKLAVLKAQMCMKRCCMFLESFQIPSCQPLVSAWRYWMSEGMWNTSCLFYFMAFLKDIKHVFIPEFNKTQIILAEIELLPRPLLNHAERVRLAEALLGFQRNSSSCLTLTDAQPSPRPKPQPAACVRKHLLHSPAQKTHLQNCERVLAAVQREFGQKSVSLNVFPSAAVGDLWGSLGAEVARAIRDHLMWDADTHPGCTGGQPRSGMAPLSKGNVFHLISFTKATVI